MPIVLLIPYRKDESPIDQERKEERQRENNLPKYLVISELPEDPGLIIRHRR